MNARVELHGVTKIYDAASPQRALSGVSLTIPAGQVTAVMGPSGSGKSTLLNLIAGLDRATNGSITVAGLPITRLVEAALARSSTHGVRFGPSRRMSSAAFDPLMSGQQRDGSPWIGDYQGLAVGAGTVHPFWNDTRTGRMEIFTAAERIAASRG